MKNFKLAGEINPERRRRFFKYLLRNATRVRAEKDVAYRIKFVSKINKINDSGDEFDYDFVSPHIKTSKKVKNELLNKANEEMKKELNKKTLEKAIFEQIEEDDEKKRNNNSQSKRDNSDNINKPKASLVSQKDLVSDLKERIKEIKSQTKDLPRNDPIVSALHDKIDLLNNKIKSLEGKKVKKINVINNTITKTKKKKMAKASNKTKTTNRKKSVTKNTIKRKV